MPLTFFIELPAARLAQLLARREVVAALQRARAGVAMAMLDLTVERAQMIDSLVQAGVPVTAWLTLAEGEGYWLGADNAPAAAARYREVRDFIAEHDLWVPTVALDIEPPCGDAVALAHHGLRALRRLVRRRRTHRAVAEAAERYARLIREIRDDGFAVESYQFPLIVDERRAGSAALQKVLGVVDMLPDREVLMLYRSMLPPWLGDLIVDAYGPDADGIALGVTGGGVTLLPAEGRQVTLPELLADLRHARRYTEQLYVFSLEGCVAAGYLDALCDAAIQPARRPAPLGVLGRPVRAALRTLLRAEPLCGRFVARVAR